MVKEADDLQELDWKDSLFHGKMKFNMTISGPYPECHTLTTASKLAAPTVFCLCRSALGPCPGEITRKTTFPHSPESHQFLASYVADASNTFGVRGLQSVLRQQCQAQREGGGMSGGGGGGGGEGGGGGGGGRERQRREGAGIGGGEG